MREKPRVHGGVEGAALRRWGHGREKMGKNHKKRSKIHYDFPYVSITVIIKKNFLGPSLWYLNILIYSETATYYLLLWETFPNNSVKHKTIKER